MLDGLFYLIWRTKKRSIRCNCTFWYSSFMMIRPSSGFGFIRENEWYGLQRHMCLQWWLLAFSLEVHTGLLFKKQTWVHHATSRWWGCFITPPCDYSEAKSFSWRSNCWWCSIDRVFDIWCCQVSCDDNKIVSDKAGNASNSVGLGSWFIDTARLIKDQEY